MQVAHRPAPTPNNGGQQLPLRPRIKPPPLQANQQHLKLQSNCQGRARPLLMLQLTLRTSCSLQQQV